MTGKIFCKIFEWVKIYGNVPDLKYTQTWHILLVNADLKSYKKL